MSRQIEICRKVAEALQEAFSGVLGVTVAVEDGCVPSLEIERALGKWGVLVLVGTSGHRRKPGTGASTADDLAIDLTVVENPQKNRKSGTDEPTVTGVAEAAKDALHWRSVDGMRLVYVEMARADGGDDDYRMAVSFAAFMVPDPTEAVRWGIGEETVYGAVTKKTVTRGGENIFEPDRHGCARWVGTRDRHWAIALTCTVTTQSEDDLPEKGEPFEYGGRTYYTHEAAMTCDAEDTATVRLAGRTMESAG